MSGFVTRFAPSPTGLIHLGTAYSAFVVLDAARRAGGTAVLRIEDIDTTRCRPDFIDAMLEDLSWLGMEWDGPVRRQSAHLMDYEAALATLIERDLVYRCFRTRKELAADITRAPHLSRDGPDGPIFTGGPLPERKERARLDAGHAYSWRLSMERCRDYLGEAFDLLSFIEEDLDGRKEVHATPEIFGDVIIARKDIGTSYHLACTHDDALQGITNVIRGEDLYASTHLHRLLQVLLDYPEPTYRHHRLLLGRDGKKFSKRDASKTIRSLREAGETPESIRAMMEL